MAGTPRADNIPDTAPPSGQRPMTTDSGAPSGGEPEASGGRLFDNFLSLFSAQTVAAVAGLVSTAFLARALAPEAYGYLGFGAAVLSYFGLLVLFGTDTIGMREIARDRAVAGPLTSRILGLRAVLLAFVSVLFLFVVGWMDRPEEVKIVMVIQGAGLLVTIFTLDFVCQGLQRMRAMALRQAVAPVLVLAGVLMWVKTPDDVYIAAAIPVLAIGISVIGLFIHLRRRVTKFSLSFDTSGWRPLLGQSSPVLVTAFLGTIFLNIDVVMLGFMVDGTDVGIYVGMARIYVTTLMLAGLIASVFSPALAAAFPSRGSMARRYDDFCAAAMFVGAPIVAMAIAFPRDIIEILFGSGFLEGEAALILLMLAALTNHLVIAGAAALVAWDDQTAKMMIYGAGATVNIALNLVLIPAWGIEGAALATFAAQGVIFAGVAIRLWRKFDLVNLNTSFLMGASAAAAFAIVVYIAQVAGGALISDSVVADLILKAAIGGGLYVWFAVLTKAVKPSRLFDALWDSFDGKR